MYPVKILGPEPARQPSSQVACDMAFGQVVERKVGLLLSKVVTNKDKRHLAAVDAQGNY